MRTPEVAGLGGLDPGVKDGEEARAGAGQRAVGQKPGGAARTEMKAAESSAEALGGKDRPREPYREDPGPLLMSLAVVSGRLSRGQCGTERPSRCRRRRTAPARAS